MVPLDTSKTQSTNEITDKLDNIKIKNFSVKDNIRIIRQDLEWEKVFAKDKSDKELFSKIYKKTCKTQQ